MDALREVYQVEARKLEGPMGQPNYKSANARLLNTTDPDAPCVRNGKAGGSGDSRARYKQHRVVDDAKGVITAIKTTPATKKSLVPITSATKRKQIFTTALEAKHCIQEDTTSDEM